jgi:hypothetical protein
VPALRETVALNCLVVAADGARRENLGFAAREGGWDVTLCSDSQTAIHRASHVAQQMAIVDMTGVSPATATYRFLVEQLACGSRMLLLICGNLDDQREEIWARHLGVWMYLPGAIEGSDLISLCTAARQAVERLNHHRPRQPSAGPPELFRPA